MIVHSAARNAARRVVGMDGSNMGVLVNLLPGQSRLKRNDHVDRFPGVGG